jgi:hypothetical protein
MQAIAPLTDRNAELAYPNAAGGKWPAGIYTDYLYNEAAHMNRKSAEVTENMCM